MGEGENIRDRACWLAQEAEKGGEHLLQSQKELNNVPSGIRGEIAAQMERTSRLDHAKRPYKPELDVKTDPDHKGQYIVSWHKADPLEGTIRAGHDGQSGLAVTEEISGTVGAVGGAAYGGLSAYPVGYLGSLVLGDGTIALYTGAGALGGGLVGAGIGLGIGLGVYGAHKLYEVRKEDPKAFDSVALQYLRVPIL